MKYNCAVLFWSQLYWLFIYASKYIFPYKKILIDAHRVPKFNRNYWYRRFRKKLLKFLQGAEGLNENIS